MFRPGWEFSLWIYGVCMVTVTFLKAVDPQNEHCRALQPGLYFPDAHLLPMADGMLQGKDEFLRIMVFC